VAVGGALRVHTGQAIGILGGAIKAGDKAAGTGLTMIAGSGDVDVQAQAGTLQVAALDDVKIQSQSANIDWASAKKITLATAGGASIVIEGGNVTVMCPGTITVHAGTKSFVGAERVEQTMPVLPSAQTSWLKVEAHYDDAWNTAWPLTNARVKLDCQTVAESLALYKN
jgi:type VI secretion system secreted protein VgrG